jgi:hypothetical protein
VGTPYREVESSKYGSSLSDLGSQARKKVIEFADPAWLVGDVASIRAQLGNGTPPLARITRHFDLPWRPMVRVGL